MRKVIWKLDKVIEELNITPNKLSIEARCRPNTIYNMVYGTATRIHLETIEKVLVALNNIAESEGIHKGFKVGDILDFIDK
jgi:predicted transcriptional regulator